MVAVSTDAAREALRESVKVTRRLKRLHDTEGELTARRRTLWRKARQGGVMPSEIMAACGVSESLVTKALRPD